MTDDALRTEWDVEEQEANADLALLLSNPRLLETVAILGDEAADPFEVYVPTPTLLEVRKAGKKSRRRLSEHFWIEEFDCNDGTHVPRGYGNQCERWCHWVGEPAHKEFGTIYLNSGYRHTAYNRRIGGAPLSFHDYLLRPPGDGIAVDWTAEKGNPRAWAEFAEDLLEKKRNGNGGLGRYSNFVHVDTRDYVSRWTG